MIIVFDSFILRLSFNQVIYMINNSYDYTFKMILYSCSVGVYGVFWKSAIIPSLKIEGLNKYSVIIGQVLTFVLVFVWGILIKSA